MEEIKDARGTETAYDVDNFDGEGDLQETFLSTLNLSSTARDEVPDIDPGDAPEFPWSGYTLPDGYRPHIDLETFEASSPNSGLSGASVNTDPFEVDQPAPEYQALSDSSVGKHPPDLAKSNNGVSPRSSFSNEESNNSAGFEYTELEHELPEERYATALNIASPASFGFNMPDMGFCGMASPPNSGSLHHHLAVNDWIAGREVPHRQIPIYRHRRSSTSSGDESGGSVPIRRGSAGDDLLGSSPRSIPNSPRWLLIDGQCYSFSPASVGPIPNSPPQSPLYRRQSNKQARIFQDINENLQLINTPALFLQSKKCYDLIPMSGKLVVFDKRLLVRKAFVALIVHGTRAAPVWDSSSQSYTGMLTITDFITILNYHFNKEGPINIANIIENKTIEEWKKISEQGKKSSELISIDPMETLFTAAKVLLENKIHRLPVVDPRSGNTLYIITHKRILNFIYPYLIESNLDPLFDDSIQELGIGTYEEVKQLKYDSTLMDALNFFASTRVSAIPIIDDEGKVVDIYARFDVITIASKGKYNDLNMSIRECLLLRSSSKVEVLTCQGKDSLIKVIRMIYRAQVHRLVVVDRNQSVVGLVSLSDLFRFLVFRADLTARLTAPSIDEEEYQFGEIELTELT